MLAVQLIMAEPELHATHVDGIFIDDSIAVYMITVVLFHHWPELVREKCFIGQST